jgi:hypothetical protein
MLLLTMIDRLDNVTASCGDRPHSMQGSILEAPQARVIFEGVGLAVSVFATVVALPQSLSPSSAAIRRVVVDADACVERIVVQVV